MANPSAHRLSNSCHSSKATGSQSSVIVGGGSLPANSSSAAMAAALHHQRGAAAAAAGTKAHYRGHQRRQSVARLLPDISKLRLLSWLVEASSELINCDIAIMDGVYAKLNRSQESLLFWNGNTPSSSLVGHHQPPTTTTGGSSSRRPPPPPSVQPVANNIVISQSQSVCRLYSASRAARNHHSLPLTNYDASSLAAVSLSPSLLGPRRSRGGACDTDSIMSAGNCSSQPTSSGVCSATDASAAGERSSLCDNSLSHHQRSSTHNSQNNNNNNNNNEDSCDSNQSDDDDDSSAAGSTTSSGIHGGTSLSSASSCSAASTASGDLGAGGSSEQPMAYASSAEQLSEKIRRTVMEHNYLQSLLVNIIRQHDLQRNQLSQQRRHQLSAAAHQQQHHHAQFDLNKDTKSQLLQQQQHQRIDLAEIADALDDGCLCLCHSTPSSTPMARDHPHRQQQQGNDTRQESSSSSSSKKQARSSTLPTTPSSGKQQQQPGDTITTTSTTTVTTKASAVAATSAAGNNNQVPSRTVRRKKKNCGNHGNSNELNRQDIINLLGDKLCESCYETHYWLHGCSIELLQPKTTRQQHEAAASSSSSSQSPHDSNSIISKRNATFIKLVQQQVRSTISKSIELIDLIRKEIKSPESIKQKQLMRCFSTSIQLLTSVGNYVVPTQDISSFIPEVGQHQTTLFCLPPSDFDHLLLYPTSSVNSNHHHHHHHQQQQATVNSNYHLASAPEIPIRRRFNGKQKRLGEHSDSNGSSSSPAPNCAPEQALSSNLQRLKTSDNLGTTGAESSSGASSNNSSASSSIARGAVQQSSLTRARTSSAILDGKTSHDLSFEAMANLSRQQTEDDMIYQSRPKFWQSSKFNFIKKLLHVKQQRLLRQQSKDRRIYNNKVQNKFRLVMMDLTHFNKSQQLLTTENGVNSLLTSMRNVLEFGLYLTLKLY